MRIYDATLQVRQNYNGQGGNIPITTNGSLVNWGWGIHQRNRNVQLWRYNRTQKNHPLLVGVRTAVNHGLKNTNNLLVIKFRSSKWPLIIYKNKGFWLNGYKMTKTDLDMTVVYMISRHQRDLTYDEAEELFDNVVGVDLTIADTFVNKLKYSFYNDEGEEVETMLNIEQIGKTQVGIELNSGLWVAMDFKPFKSFMRGCAKYKNKWTAISPEELYYTLTDEFLSSGEIKLVHAFLEQNRHSTLVEKRSLELIQELQDAHPNRIKKVNVDWKHRLNGDDDGKPLVGMLVKGTQLDWLVFNRTHAAHQTGTQDVSTYAVISTKNYCVNDKEGGDDDTKYKVGIEGTNLPSKYFDEEPEYIFMGPICIDNQQNDVSLGDQYAARALALLNDKHTLELVSTLRSYQTYKVIHRVDLDAVSELSVN
tara:strand:- start:243 stop:1508 length:1266 start_codon:yes stop_codon:yes gene_type:complete